MGTAFLILLLLALCGFIAYIGDLLGRRLGKKRLSVFGLRPKHTAILLTIVTGVLIAGVTFSAALLAVPGFWRLVTQGEKLSVRNMRLTQQNEQLAKENTERQKQNQGLVTENSQLQSTNQGLVGTNRKLSGDNGKLTETNRKLTEQSRTLVQEKQRLSGQNATLGRQNETLVKTNKQLASASREIKGENAALLQERGRLNQQVKDAQHAAKDYLQQAERLKLIANSYRADQYIFRNGEQLDTQVVLRRPPLDVLIEGMKNLQFNAEKKARERHGSAYRGPVIRMVPPLGYPAGRPRTEAQMVRWAAEQAFALRDQQMVIRILAHENSVAGRPVPVRLDWYTNDQVFKAGDVVASRIVPGGAPEEAIIMDLINFLQLQVRRTATSPPYSMIPDEDEALGQASIRLLLDKSREIKAVDGPVLLQARARTDTRRSGPLNLDLEVKPLEPVSRQSR